MKILAKNKTETVQGFTFFAFLLLVFKWYGSEGVDILSSPFAIFCLLLCLLLALLAWDFPPLFFFRRWACVFCFFIIIYIYIYFLFVIFLNPFTAPACQISGLKSTLYTLYAISIFSRPVANPLWNWILYVLMKIKSVLLSSNYRKEKGNKKAWRFSNFTLFK